VKKKIAGKKYEKWVGSRLGLAKLARGFFSRLNKIFFPLSYASFWQTVYQHAVANKKYTTYI
tara:strand:- start:231 stop:416 length:186 start_codon:yes stop_codon:yes gene_type:complete